METSHSTQGSMETSSVMSESVVDAADVEIKIRCHQEMGDYY
jgi:hypothetical protein